MPSRARSTSMSSGDCSILACLAVGKVNEAVGHLLGTCKIAVDKLYVVYPLPVADNIAATV